MNFKPSRIDRENCYPFIFEKSLKCDYEILTDELCRIVGGILEYTEMEFPNLHSELDKLQPLIYHLNGSIRGKMAITENDLKWLKSIYSKHCKYTKDSFSSFILPRGKQPILLLNIASSLSKKIIRIMVRMQNEENIDIDNKLSIFTNLLCNYFFILTLVINKLRGIPEIEFVSNSYSTKNAK